MHLSPLRLAFVGPYPPTPCGIATFTESLRSAIVTAAAVQDHRVTADVIRLSHSEPEPPTPPVIGDWIQGDRTSLHGALGRAATYDVVVLQHEFGIFGGPDGEDVLDFVEACPVPVVVVLHTVLPGPSANQRRIVEALADMAEVTVVQSDAALTLLCQRYVVDAGRVAVIPHGAEPNFEGPAPSLADHDRPVLLTWGLLGPGKGIEHAIRALAKLPSDIDMPTYVVAGRTHPNVVAADGEQYRDGLKALATRLGVAEHVVFDDSYRSWDELRSMVRGCDIVVLPYDSRDQVTSGVLVEALASARPVIATAFPHAKEALGSGGGIVVPHEDVDAIAQAIAKLVRNPILRQRVSNCARTEATSLLWPRVGERYLDLLPLPIGIRGVA